MKKSLFIPFLLFTTALLAQEEQKAPSFLSHDSSIFVSSSRFIGYSSVQFEGLNNRIKSLPQYEDMPTGMGTLGLGTTNKFGHFVTMGGLTLGYGKKGDGDRKSTSIGMLGVNMDIGYNFFKPTARIEIIPTAGLGFEAYKTWLKRDLSAVPFDSVLQYPSTQTVTRSVSFSNYFITYRFGLNIGFISSNRMFTIGLQGGYTGSFEDKQWKVNDSQILRDAPADGVKRFYGNLYMNKRINWKRSMMNMHM